MASIAARSHASAVSNSFFPFDTLQCPCANVRGIYNGTYAGHVLASFDISQRERIRAALIGYMKEHGIRVPTLAVRIRQSHPREMEIPLKTLQRFLAGRRTQDMALTICAAFVEKLPHKPTA